jgi:hypothetical protein
MDIRWKKCPGVMLAMIAAAGVASLACSTKSNETGTGQTLGPTPTGSGGAAAQGDIPSAPPGITTPTVPSMDEVCAVPEGGEGALAIIPDADCEGGKKCGEICNPCAQKLDCAKPDGRFVCNRWAKCVAVQP